MDPRRRIGGVLALLAILMSAGTGSGQPPLDASFRTPGSAELTWPGTDTGYVVQRTEVLGEAPSWETHPHSPTIQDDDHRITISLGYREAGFFRLVLPKHENAVAGGLDYLRLRQTADGTWGAATGSERRMVHSVLDVLAGFGAQDSLYFRQGARALDLLPVRNHDDAARKAMVLVLGGRDPTLLCDLLAAGQNGPVLQPTDIDFPGYGWGLGPGLDNDHLDTALALRALSQSGRPIGLGLAPTPLAPGSDTHTYRFLLPTGATGFELRIAEQTGAVRYTLTPPGGTAQAVDNPDTQVPTSIALDSAFPGVWTLAVTSLSPGGGFYSLAVGYVSAEGIDAFRTATAFDLLCRHQNADGGWGLRPGEPSLLITTYEVMRALAVAGRTNFQSWLARGADWLRARQNPDGGFSTIPGQSHTYDTALALAAIRLADPTDLVPDAMTWLRDRQLPVGSWQDDPFLTALAVQALSLAPIVSPIPDQTVSPPSLFAAIALDDYVVDPDHEDALLSWQTTGHSELNVSLSNRVATITYPPGTETSEPITFTATDPDGQFDRATATFTVASAPPDYVIPAGGSVNDSFVISSVSPIPASYPEVVSTTAPPGLRFALGNLDGSGNQQTQLFTLSVDAGTPPGMLDITVVLRLMDLTVFPLAEVPNLNGTTQHFRVEVTP